MQFDIQKIFHLYKPNYDRHSAITGKQNDDRNPTLSSNSWGYRSTSWQTDAWYWYRPSNVNGVTATGQYTIGTEPSIY